MIPWNEPLLLSEMNDDDLHLIVGNYDSFVQTRSEKEEEQEKRYKAEQDQIKHMKSYVAKFGQGQLNAVNDRYEMA